MANFTHIFCILNLIAPPWRVHTHTYPSSCDNHIETGLWGSAELLQARSSFPHECVQSPVLTPSPLLPSPLGPRAATWLWILQRHTKSNPHRKLCLLLELYKCVWRIERERESCSCFLASCWGMPGRKWNVFIFLSWFYQWCFKICLPVQMSKWFPQTFDSREWLA